MRIRLYSDLHWEFHADKGRSWLASQDKTGMDVVVLAGDISSQGNICEALQMAADYFAPIPVLYTNGNHEAYFSTFDHVYGEIQRAVKSRKNLHWLNNDIFELKGQRFLGSTLWFFKGPAEKGPKHCMAYYKVIRDIEPRVYEENAKAVSFFRKELRQGDVMITHHLPSHLCVADPYKGSPLNAYFVCDMLDLIKELKPTACLFGHTHTSVDKLYQHEDGADTWFVCNPFGYLGQELNPQFLDNLNLEIV